MSTQGARLPLAENAVVARTGLKHFGGSSILRWSRVLHSDSTSAGTCADDSDPDLSAR